MPYSVFRLMVGLFLLGACSPASPAPTVAGSGDHPLTSRPSLIPAASTSESTLSPAPSPTPPPCFFTEDFSSDPAYWILVVTNGNKEPQVHAEAGFLEITLNEPDTWIYQVFLPYEYADVRVEARFEPLGSEPSSTGVICRYTEKNGWYEFNLSRDGSYNILLGQWLAQDIAQYVPILKDESEYIKPDQAAYEMGLGCLENVLWLYINGNLIRKVDVTRFGLGTGKIGLAAASFENVPVISAFDWIRVSEYVSPP